MSQPDMIDIEAIEVASTNAGLGAGFAIVKLESTEMTMIARQNPRSHEAVLADIVAQLKAYPAFAREAIYSKPVGKEYHITCECKYQYTAQKVSKEYACPRCNQFKPKSSREVVKYARNLSIRASEAIFSSWGNCAASFVPLADTPDYAEFAAIFMDYERCTKISFPVRVSKSYKTRGGNIVLHNPDRFSDVILAAARSRALREVINRSIPPGLRAELFDRAEEILNGLLDEKTQLKLVAAFADIGISQQQIEDNAGKQLIHFTQQDRKELLGLYEGIRSGEITKEEAFPPPATLPEAGRAEFGFTSKQNGDAAQTPAPAATESAVPKPEPTVAPTADEAYKADPANYDPDTGELIPPSVGFTQSTGQQAKTPSFFDGAAKPPPPPPAH